jgi:23S rRNA (pseudouridine1915-N3)-methyltransferase
MQMQLLVTGRVRDMHLKALEAEYLKRLPPHWQFLLRELPESGEAEAAVARQAESGGQLVALAGLPAPAVRVVLDERGEAISSRQLAERMERWQNQSVKCVALLVGGATGVSKEVVQRADWVWSLGPLTFPHQLVRTLVLEQLYRAHTIMVGHPYHKD